ncbi:MAG TPA: DUF1015 domain-containing protein [Firmicutes bacterium]|nr:DUF1015 domain-containing protein [Bacillota bacterium]
MAEIKPFAALRFTGKAGRAEEITCPPYDIISEEERRGYLARNPHNVIRLELPRAEGEGADPYAEAGRVLQEWLAEGILARDQKPALYIYEEAFTAGGRSYAVRGFICRVRLEEFSKGVVLPHEETLSKAKADRFNLMCATGCNFSQIYSLYMDEGGQTRRAVEALSSGQPAQCFTDGAGVTHRLWIAEDGPAVEEICRQFAGRKLYIADGHHRYETALRYRDHLREAGGPAGDSDYVMMMLVDMENPGLVVFPTHRIVRDLPAFDGAALLRDCEAYFDVMEQDSLSTMDAALETAYAAGQKAFGFYDGGSGWHLLRLRDPAVMAGFLPKGSKALRELDVSVLHSLVLERLLHIDKENMANQVNLTYTRDKAEALEAVREGADCCFILNPTRVEEISAVAAAGEKMPQKSTYFYPKLITGLVMNQIL